MVFSFFLDKIIRFVSFIVKYAVNSSREGIVLTLMWRDIVLLGHIHAINVTDGLLHDGISLFIRAYIRVYFRVNFAAKHSQLKVN